MPVGKLVLLFSVKPIKLSISTFSINRSNLPGLFLLNPFTSSEPLKSLVTIFLVCLFNRRPPSLISVVSVPVTLSTPETFVVIPVVPLPPLRAITKSSALSLYVSGLLTSSFRRAAKVKL